MTGGLDSYILWRLSGRPHGIYFDIGGKYSEIEKQKLQQIEDHFGKKYFKVIRKFSLGEYSEDDGYVPYRNLFLFLWTSLEYSKVELLFGQVLEWVVDKNKIFYKQVESMVKVLGRRQMKIITPHAKLTKTKTVAMFLERGYPKEELINLTYSCLEGTIPPCGICLSCMNRYIAFKNNKLEEALLKIPTKEDFLSNIKEKKYMFKLRTIPIILQRYKEAKGILL